LAQKDYTAGTIKETACTYAVINKAKTLQTVAVNDMVLYETAKNASTQAALLRTNNGYHTILCASCQHAKYFIF
jgi:hypothetical protein